MPKCTEDCFNCPFPDCLRPTDNRYKTQDSLDRVIEKRYKKYQRKEAKENELRKLRKL